MTTEEYIRKLDSRIEELGNAENFLSCFLAAYGSMRKRVFEEGDLGGKKYSYSTKPIYVSEKNSPRALKKIGKTGKETKTSRYYKGGYKEFRADVGLQNRFIDLDLFGDFRRDSAKLSKEDKSTYAAKVSRPINEKKLMNFRDRFDGVFTHTKEEIEDLKKCVQSKAIKILSSDQ